MIEEKSWAEFRESGLLWFVNTTLHMFGWALCYDPDTQNVFPSRCKFRGFSDNVNTEGYQKVSTYLKNNIEQIAKESFE